MRSFQDILTDLYEGQVHEQLTAALAEVVQGVMHAKKAGALTLTLSIVPEGSQAVVKAKIATKVPRAATEATVFFTTKDGELRRDDPRQLPLRNVKKQADEAMRRLPETTGPAGKEG